MLQPDIVQVAAAGEASSAAVAPLDIAPAGLPGPLSAVLLSTRPTRAAISRS